MNSQIPTSRGSACRWLEVALNGPWTRQHQPNIPITEAEIIEDAVACVHEGASIVHVHAYDPATGRQKDDPDIYSRIIEGIRRRVDAIVYPTVPFAASSDGPGAANAMQDRFSAVEVLARRGLLEMSVVDLGSLNFVSHEEISHARDGFVHTNSVSEIRRNLKLAGDYGFHPNYTIYEAGFLRFGAAMRRSMPSLLAPIYRFMLSDIYTFGAPPSDEAVAYLAGLLDRLDPGMPWMVAGLGIDAEPLFAHALGRGGHVRVGLEDLPPHSKARNRELVASAIGLMHREGFTAASASDIRSQLASVIESRE